MSNSVLVFHGWKDCLVGKDNPHWSKIAIHVLI